jgi:hypothetical protein
MFLRHFDALTAGIEIGANVDYLLNAGIERALNGRVAIVVKLIEVEVGVGVDEHYFWYFLGNICFRVAMWPGI